MRRLLLTTLLIGVALTAYACGSQDSPTAPTGPGAGLGVTGAPAVPGADVTSEQQGARAPKVDMCHVTGNGTFRTINISANAVPSHVAHGDAAPFEEDPGQPGNVFSSACVPSVFSIDIEKSTNGDDADAPPGPRLTVGEAVAWEYVVTNTGDSTMVNVTVTDDKGVVVSCLVTELAAGASLTCSAQGAVQEGPYVNTGTATGDSCGSGTSVLCGGGAGFQATDSDESHYLGEAVKLDTDGDGTPDDVDLDDGNDGQTDSQELTCGSDPLNPESVCSTDTDGDGWT